MADPARCPDLSYLGGSAVTLFHKDAVLSAAISTMKAEGYEIVEVDAATPQSLLDGLDNALNWSQTFGYVPDKLNLDALDDVLIDRTGERLLIVFLNYQAFAARDAFRARGLLDVLSSHARSWLLASRRLAVFVQSDDPKLELTALGAQDARWNRQEWAHASRGL